MAYGFSLICVSENSNLSLIIFSHNTFLWTLPERGAYGPSIDFPFDLGYRFKELLEPVALKVCGGLWLRLFSF